MNFALQAVMGVLSHVHIHACTVGEMGSANHGIVQHVIISLGIKAWVRIFILKSPNRREWSDPTPNLRPRTSDIRLFGAKRARREGGGGEGPRGPPIDSCCEKYFVVALCVFLTRGVRVEDYFLYFLFSLKSKC
ncbi:hypothetical protein BDW02DRAFT_65238 [Decorospora gaudefroyi]|uniref:Uncharacterized protein n=1 Tax=Decorospora gaudefroyi TaxID=184978 RepID=A0A6A5K4C1_9PLEO|nr:hypothetical protein BDW02DRAFT_65238 [Decorospora gaudefroyi]